MEVVALLTAVDALVGMDCTALNVTEVLVGTTLLIKQRNTKRRNYRLSCRAVWFY
ncbi:hypothetical protein [Pseudalkalibacillus sp. R45]|uniref:hypothetical protein n=1 Tax=Pseudalkalibacillus sp. R45 TaxID=3457433 RepID=UPI003FCDE470